MLRIMKTEQQYREIVCIYCDIHKQKIRNKFFWKKYKSVLTLQNLLHLVTTILLTTKFQVWWEMLRGLCYPVIAV